MATPKRKTSHARTAQRKAHWLGSLGAPSTTKCTHCGEAVMSHRACPSCGFYKGRKVIDVKEI
ncbi:MAG: 50S ribosomal protein L32 [Synergistaceae bacterium]|jgi:large subunit ribosomal protein L32|nr:50S ribosomal protein L32 [Synergistaceae bacterium]